ncbi:MAG: hypothetical protein QNK19_16330, partial [Xanthomonadales bacterium]|nr:hypothetical protein [Xanthomonadales bacterium]
MRFLFTALLLTFLIACDTSTSTPVTQTEIQTETAEVPGLPAGFQDAQESIRAVSMLADVTIIAGDQFEGRGAGTEGDRKARTFLANRLAEMGFEPFFDNASFEQPVEIIGLTVQNPEDIRFNTEDGTSIAFGFGDEYMIMAGAQQPKISVEDAEVVFVGYGIQAPEENWDDFKNTDLSG